MSLVSGRREVSKVQRRGNRALLYLDRLRGGQSLEFSLLLKSKYPLKVQARPSVIYEYYKPENRSESRPRNGPAMNWAAKNDAARRVTICGLRSNSFFA